MIWGSWVSIGDEFISKPIILFRILSIIYLGLNKIEFKKKYCIEPTTPNILSDFTRITRMFFYSNCLVQLKIVEDGLVSVGCENHGCWKLEPTVHLGNVIVVLPNSGYLQACQWFLILCGFELVQSLIYPVSRTTNLCESRA